MPKAKGMDGSLDTGRGQRRGISGKGGREKPDARGVEPRH